MAALDSDASHDQQMLAARTPTAVADKPASSEELGRRFKAWVSIGAGTLEPCYAPAAELELMLAGRRETIVGREAIMAELGSWWHGPGPLPYYVERVSATGLTVHFERGETDAGPAARQLHRLHVEGGMVVRHLVHVDRPRFRLRAAPPAPALGRIIGREPITTRSACAGSWVERIHTTGGWRVVKHIDTTDDWIMRATGDTGREVELWRSGAFDRLPAGVEVPIIDAAPVDGGGWQLIMRDAGADLLGEGQRLDRRGIRRLFGAAQAIHRAFEGRPPSGLCTLGDRLRLFSRSTAERERGANNLGPKVHLRLWEVFADVAPPDIADVVLGLHADPSALCDELLACGRTLLHGDLKPGNIGLPPGRVVLIDWQLACEGPPAIDFIWPLAFEESFDATLDELLEDIRRVAGPDHDERALQLSIIFHMAMAAAEEAVHVVDDPDEAKRARAAAVLSWWVDKTRHALETTWAP